MNGAVGVSSGGGAPLGGPDWVLRLYVAGAGEPGRRARAALERLCERHLGTSWSLEVVDVVAAPERADADQVVALPTVVRVRPAPVRKLIGDLTLSHRVAAALGLPPLEGEP